MIDQLFQLMAMIHLRVKTQIYFCVAQPQFPVLKLCTDHSTDLIHALMSFPGNKGRSHLNMGHRHGKTVWGAWYNDTCDCAATGPKSTTVPCRFFDQTSDRNETHRVICDVIHLNWNLDHTSKTPNQRLLHDSFHACSNGWDHQIHIPQSPQQSLAWNTDTAGTGPYSMRPHLSKALLLFAPKPGRCRQHYY